MQNKENEELPKWEVIPMDLIDPLARKIAVAWMECDDKDWIGNKHKLASDLMNYANHICTGMKNAVEEQLNEMRQELFKANDTIEQLNKFANDREQ